ncbi:MAG TPA: aminoglycoside phosphotransferase [Actinomycetota bacterium]
MDEVDARVEGLGGDVLLPPRLAGAVTLGARPAHRDSLPLPGGALLSVFETDDEVIVAPLVPEADGVRRALAGDGAYEGILRAIAGSGATGAFRAVRWGEVPSGGTERTIDVDQSNESVVVGDAAVVKLYPRTGAGPQPGLDLPAHLAAVGFVEMPRPIGAIVWDDGQGREALVASAASYLPGARDGWDWFVELVEGAANGDVPWAVAEAPADVIGGLVARLHLALATPSSVFPEPVTEARPAAWLDAAEHTLDEALALTTGPEGDRLRLLADDARGAIRALADTPPVAAIRIHGDLHVGQILRWEDGDAIGDFDGNPLAPAGVRVAPGPPARDVASMARAIDHVGRIVARRRPGRADEVARWIREARARFLAAYRAGLGHDASRLFHEPLLHPLEVAQECHEYVYAARYIPRWVYVPDAALPALLEHGP